MAHPRVAVIGPGLMGQGIARLLQRAGWPVLLLGREATADEAGLRVQLAGCDLAIETVPEDRALKTALLGRLQRALPAHALLASNTSGLPIGGLGAGLADPGRFLGLHFFSPAERMRLVEVVAGPASSETTVQQALAWMQALGQAPVRVRDGPGFFTSRVFAAYLDEAVAMVGEGVEVARIDAAGLALGRAIGALALLDQIGLRLNLQQARQALLQERRDRLGTALSGGQQQMLAVGRALLGNPRVLLLDEPSEGLSPVLVDELARVFNQIRETGTGVLLVEQHLNLVRRTTQRFVVLAKGEIIDRGLTEDIDSEQHRAALAF